MNRIDPMVDVAFKMIFSEEHLLKSFLNSFLDFEIKNLKISHQVPTKKENIKAKESFLDIIASTKDGKIINIEVQLSKQSFYEKRSLFYASKLVTGDLKVSEEYTEVPKVISINILDFVLFNEITVFKTHFVMFERKQEAVLKSHPETYFIEMPKISREELTLHNKFHHWLLFLKPSKNESLYKEVIRLDNNIKKAEKKVQDITQDPKLKAIYDARFKQLTDEANRLSTAKNEGKIENAKSVINHMRRKGYSNKEIKDMTGMDPEIY